MSTPAPVPIGQVARRVLNFFWLVDCSGSMEGPRIATLNQAIREAVPEIKEALKSHPEINVMMRAIKFADTATWHIGPSPVPIDRFVWPELSSGGATSTGQAIRLLASELTLEKIPGKSVPPVCILISDGHQTERQEDYDRSISELLALPWGMHAVRLAIAIGSDESEYDADSLLKFVSHKEVGLLKAHSAQELTKFIKWAATEASRGASLGKSKGEVAGGNVHVHLSSPPPTDPAATAETEGF